MNIHHIRSVSTGSWRSGVDSAATAHTNCFRHRHHTRPSPSQIQIHHHIPLSAMCKKCDKKDYTVENSCFFLYNIEDISLLFFCNEVIRWLVIWRIVMVLVTIHRHRTFFLPSHAMLYMRMYFCLFAMRNQMYNPYTQHSPWMHISLELLRHLVPSKTRSANRWMTSWPPAWQYKAQGLVESWYGIHFSERPRYSWSSKAEHCRARKSGSFPEHH